jgi:hypothetical protein
MSDLWTTVKGNGFRAIFRVELIYWLPVALVIFIGFGIAAAVIASLTTVSQHSEVQEKCVSRDTGCGFAGNPDIYGLGIRLGMYLQWMSLWIAFTFLPSEKGGLRLTNHIFGFAIFVSLFIFTFRGDCMYVAEVIVILFIFLGGVASMWNFTHMHLRPSGKYTIRGQNSPFFGNMITWYFISAPMLLFSCWFWINLARGRGFHFATTPCGTSFFLFGQIKPDHLIPAYHFMAFFCVWAIFSAVIWDLSTLSEVMKYSVLGFFKVVCIFTINGVLIIYLPPHL